jgi:hypothetical protein
MLNRFINWDLRHLILKLVIIFTKTLSFGELFPSYWLFVSRLVSFFSWNLINETNYHKRLAEMSHWTKESNQGFLTSNPNMDNIQNTKDKKKVQRKSYLQVVGERLLCQKNASQTSSC